METEIEKKIKEIKVNPAKVGPFILRKIGYNKNIVR